MSYWAKSSSYFHCQAIQRLYFKLKLKSLLYLIRNRFDLDSTSSKPRWVGPLLCPLHGDLQRVITEIDQIASQIIYYIVPTCIIHSQTQVSERVSGRWQGHHYWDHWSFQWRSRTSLGLRIRRGQTDPEGHMVQRIECHLRYVISWLIFLHDLHRI